MATTEQYERILDELANGELDELEIRVFHYLRRVYPALLTRYDLIEMIFGYRPVQGENLNNNSDDRKIRTAIVSLLDKGVPILSTSGFAGYCIDINLGKWSLVVEELEKRKESLEKKLDSVHRIMRVIERSGRNAIPSGVPSHYLTASVPAEAQTPSQLSFLGGEG